MPVILFILVCTSLLLSKVYAEDPETATPLSSYEIVMSWRKLDFNFSSMEERQRKIARRDFIPENNIVTRIKTKGNRIFLVVPRWREGVPATLAYVNHDQTSATPNNPVQPQASSSPLLMPYPNWEAQAIADCKAFQYVQTIETDPFDRLWVVDTGFHSRNSSVVSHCPPKLVIMDLLTDNVLVTYTFPPPVVSANQNLLTDIVVACDDLSAPDDCWAYISDSVGVKLVVFHLRNQQSWAVRHSSMKALKSADTITILGRNYSSDTNINGLALSSRDEDFETVYYSPLNSYNLYSVSTKILKLAGSNGYLHDLMDRDVQLVGRKISQSDGLAMGSNGLLFYGVLSNNAINFWNSSDSVLDQNNEMLLVQSDIDLQWPDAFSFDDNGYIYVTTNRMQRALSDSYDFDDVNFRIVRIYVGSKSYQYSAKDMLSTEGTDNAGLSDDELSDSITTKPENVILLSLLLIPILLKYVFN